MKLASEAFSHEGAIPSKHTCEGEDVSPPLAWSDVPKGAQSLALIVSDPDAPDPKKPMRTWVHWVLYDIAPDLGGIAEGITGPPAGARDGLNDWKRTGYGGPCPPIGRHRYYFRLYALDRKLGEIGAPTQAELEQAMRGHVIEQAELLGTYQKRG